MRKMPTPSRSVGIILLWMLVFSDALAAGGNNNASPELTQFKFYDIVLLSGIAMVYLYGHKIPSGENGNWKNGVDLKTRQWAQAGMNAPSRAKARSLSNQIGLLFLAPAILPPLLYPFDKANRIQYKDIILISIRSFAAEKFFGLLIKNLSGRERPREIGCREDMNYTALCTANKDKYRSFYSAHTATAFNFAGLWIFQQKYQDPYGLDTWLEQKLGPVGKGLILYGTPLAIAGSIGWCRIKSEEHWLTDVAAGAAVGLGTGFLMPKYFYTGKRASKSELIIYPDGAALAFHF